MGPMQCVRLIAGAVTLFPATGGSTPTSVAPILPALAAAASAPLEDDSSQLAGELTSLPSATNESWLIEVIPTPAGTDFKIEVLRSDPNVRCEIVVLDSQGRFREPGRTGTTAPDSGELRRVLSGRSRGSR